jgi:hypothetical protein
LTNILFTTLFPHALYLADEWNWGDPVRIVSTGITDGKVSALSSTNPYLSIVSETQFQLTGLNNTQFVGTFPLDGSGYYGYVLAPGIAGPVYLAKIVTAGLNYILAQYASDNDVIVSAVRIDYDLQSGQFILVVIAYPIRPTLVIVDPVEVVSGSTQNPTLSYIMGFGNCCISNSRDIQNIMATTLDKGHPSLLTKQYMRSGSLAASFGPLFRTFIDLDIGDYDSISALGADIDLNWNRFWFDPSCTIYTVTNYRFVFVDACGACYQISIPLGLYTPESFAQFLQSNMNSATGTNIYQVTYDGERFTFQTTNNAVFGIKFSDSPFVQYNTQNDLGQSIPVQIYNVPPQFQTVAVRLGFDNVDYRGQSSYTSIRPAIVPKKQLICNAPTSGSALQNERRFQFIGQWKVDGSSIRLPVRKRFAIYAFTPTLNGAMLSDLNGQLLVTTSLANGFQVNDILKVTIASGTTFYLRVIEILDPFRVVLDVNADILTALGALPVLACVENAALPVINLYLSQNLYNGNLNTTLATCGTGIRCDSDPNNSSVNGAIAPRLLGLGNEDVLWSAMIGFPIVGIADVKLNFPDYLLLVISLDNQTIGNTHFKHLWRFHPGGEDNRQNILAVIPSHHHNTITWERFVPSVVQLTSPSKTGAYIFQILNPDHSLYQLHNQDWSGTLNVQIVQASGTMLS